MSYEFYNPTRVLFGAGQLNHLHEQKMPGKKAMLVISNGKSTRASGALDRTMKELSLAGVEVVLFDKVGANPVKDETNNMASVPNTSKWNSSFFILLH